MATKKASRSTKKSAAKRTTAKKSAARKSPAKKSAAKKSAASGGGEAFPRRIYANASPYSLGQVSMFEPGTLATSADVSRYASDPALVERSVNLLTDAGFEVLYWDQYLVNFCGTRRNFEQAFGTELYMEDRPVIREGAETMGTHIDSRNTDVPGLIDCEGTRFEDVLEGVAIEEPAYLDAASTLDPVVDYFHLTMPGDVSVGLNADRAHRGATTGSGVTVAMLDTGFQQHPYFENRGYRVKATTLGPGTADPTVDEHGHGTGESANIFATAPDSILQPVKIATASGALVNATAAINLAATLNPDIMTNSWGANIRNGPLSASRQAQAAAVAAAVAQGITVVFSAGNGSWGFPGQHPDVISAGGVFMREDGTLEASTYTSGFNSNVYPGRRVPDVSGLVGMSPGASYIMLPIPPGCVIDVGRAGGSHPPGDETAADDGWAAFSGTSAAAPQIAGVCALIKQVCPQLTPQAVRDILMDTAVDVTQGTNSMGNAATVGPDTATGNGLVNAYKAVLVAKLRCITRPVLPPVIPPPFLPPANPPFVPPFVGPVTPVLPPFVGPAMPVRPPFVGPVTPVLPPFVGPAMPVRPPFVTPALPPVRPPIVEPAFPGPGRRQGEGLSSEDVAALERMILDDDSFGL